MNRVKINGRDIPVHFDMAALLEIEDTLGVTATEALNMLAAGSMSISRMLKLLWLGVKSGCDRHKVRLVLSYNEFVDAVQADDDLMQQLMEIIGKDMTVLNEIMNERYKMKHGEEESEEADEKKKVTGSGRSTSGS